MVAVRTRSRHARQKVSDGNPRSGADRGVERTKHARPRRPRRETVAPLSALAWTRAVEEGLRLRQRVTSIWPGSARHEGWPRASAQITQPQTGFWLFRDRVAAEQGAICGFCTLALIRISAAAAAEYDSGNARRHCEREMPRSISPRRFRRKVQRRGYCITSVTRLADARGGRAIVYDDTSDPRRSRSASADKKLFYSAASNVGDTTRRGCDKRVKTEKMKSRRARPVTTAGARIRSPRSQRSPRSRRRASPPA